MAISVTESSGNTISVTVSGGTSTTFSTTSSSVSVTPSAANTIDVKAQGPKGDKGETGPQGPAGIGPAGGTENQFVQKNSATDYDTKWSSYTLPAADGTGGQVLTTDGAGAVSFAFPQTIAEDVKNVSGGTLVKGTPVHVTGSVGNLAEVIAADAATNYPAHFVLNQDLADGAEGLGIALGFINNVDVPDASIYTEGQTVYLGAAGGWTTTKPTGTNAIQNLGVLIKVNTSGNKVSGIIMGAGRANDVPNIPNGQAWIGNASGVATPTTLAAVATSGSYSDLSGTPSIPVSGVDFDPVGTDNSTDVTLAGAYDYLTIVGQTITRNQVDYNTDIANTPSIPQSGVDFDPVGTDNSTDVTLAGAYNYLTLLGQQITLGQVDYNTDISNTPSIPQSGVDFDPVGTDNSTDVTLAGAYNYLTLLGQQITLGQVDYNTDISNTPSIPVSGVDFDPVGTDNSTDVTANVNVSDVIGVAAGQILRATDAGADKLVFWDDSESKLTYATIGTNLTMTGATLDASGGGGSANMSQSFSAPTSDGEFQTGARLVVDAYGTSPAATAGTLSFFGNTAASAVGAQSSAAAATGMLTVVTDAGDSDELLVEGVIKMSTATTTALLPTATKKGVPVYMSTTAGAVTTTAPSGTGEFVRVVGHVVDAANRTIYFKPDNTWIEL